MNYQARRLIWAGLVLVLLAGGFAVAFWWPRHSFLDFDNQDAGAADLAAVFQDVTAGSGVKFTYDNGEAADLCTMLETLGGGIALFDFDGDGLLDIFLLGGGYFSGPDLKTISGRPCKLYKNLGDWRFQDVTAQAGLQRDWFYTHGCAVADYDCDGWPDLLVTGYGTVALFHNESDQHGGRRFVEVTKKAKLDVPLWGTSAAWADLDGDGYPDLYVCQYVNWNWQTHQTCQGDSELVPRDVCGPEQFQGLPHRLFRNNRDGTFSDVSKEAGLDPRATKGLGVVVVDVNGDGRPDVYAVNDRVRNMVYLNQSEGGRLRLRDIGVAGGAAMPELAIPDGSMGVDAADYDDCGRPSLVVSTYQGELPALYHNDTVGKNTIFHYATKTSGLAAQGTSFVGWGAAFIDIDLDGREDLVMSNGHARRFPKTAGLRQKALIFRNSGNGMFQNATSEGGAYFQEVHRGRGMAFGDLDNDGRPDLVMNQLNEPVVLLRNVPAGEGAGRHWLGLELVGRNHRDVVGARVTVTRGERRLTRFLKGGGSYLSACDQRLLFGLGDADHVDGITVYWPGGQEQNWNAVPIDRYWQLREGETEARSPQASREITNKAPAAKKKGGP